MDGVRLGNCASIGVFLIEDLPRKFPCICTRSFFIRELPTNNRLVAGKTVVSRTPFLVAYLSSAGACPNQSD